jgi:hypothetical protein
VATYKVEPYVVAADVYAVSPHTGRGGWTWYTGSAGWMYRLIVESLLGLRLEGDKLRFAPCLPRIGRVQGALPVSGDRLPHRRPAKEHWVEVTCYECFNSFCCGIGQPRDPMLSW